MLYQRLLQIESRLESVFELIRSGQHSTRSIAAALHISIPTASRAITALRERGYQVRSRRTGRTWSYELLGSDQSGRKCSGLHRHPMQALQGTEKKTRREAQIA